MLSATFIVIGAILTALSLYLSNLSRLNGMVKPWHSLLCLWLGAICLGASVASIKRQKPPPSVELQEPVDQHHEFRQAFTPND